MTDNYLHERKYYYTGKMKSTLHVQTKFNHFGQEEFFPTHSATTHVLTLHF